MDRVKISADPPRGRGLILCLATAGGLGYLPGMPGTWASLAALGLAWAFSQVGCWTYLSVVGALLLAGVYASGRAAALLEQKDPPVVVIDEVVGQLLTLAGQPWEWRSLLWGLVFFRVLDILKPFPINRLEARLTGGWGIMLDDVAAGIGAWLGLFLLHYLFPGAGA